MNLLHIDSSILGQNSASRELSAAIVARLRREAPGATIAYRDLASDPLPHLSGASLAGADADEATASAAAMAEFLAADVVVIGVPMYNFNIPSQLKAWIDRLSVAGKTFRYTAEGPVGLAVGKKIIVAGAYGGFHPHGGPSNFIEPYLRFVFRFWGIEDVGFVTAEGLAVSTEQRKQSMAAANDAIAHAPVALPQAA